MRRDRFLIGILCFIGFFMILAVILFLNRQEPQGYSPDDSPEGVVRNYVLAIQEGDYQRAYQYIQDGDNKPDFAQFQQALLQSETVISPAAVQLDEIIINENNARVGVTIIHIGADPFSRSWDENAAALLVLQDVEWRIVSMPYPYWGWDWYTSPKY